jgi:hypothetical protein
MQYFQSFERLQAFTNIRILTASNPHWAQIPLICELFLVVPFRNEPVIVTASVVLKLGSMAMPPARALHYKSGLAASHALRAFHCDPYCKKSGLVYAFRIQTPGLSRLHCICIIVVNEICCTVSNQNQSHNEKIKIASANIG